MWVGSSKCKRILQISVIFSDVIMTVKRIKISVTNVDIERHTKVKNQQLTSKGPRAEVYVTECSCSLMLVHAIILNSSSKSTNLYRLLYNVKISLGLEEKHERMLIHFSEKNFPHLSGYFEILQKLYPFRKYNFCIVGMVHGLTV